MNTFANATGEHVEEIIKALRALPQCMKANTEATNTSAKTETREEVTFEEGALQAVAHLVDGLKSRYTNFSTSILAAIQVAIAGTM